MNPSTTISLSAPTTDAIAVAAIPDELKDRAQWVLWRYEHRPGQHKPTKIPYNARQPQRRADATNPSTWSPFALALARYEERACDGIGFVFSEDDPYTGIDFDGFDPNDVPPWTYEQLRSLNSYTELSPSRRGTHTIVRGQVPGPRRRKGGVEMYDRARYFTFTGWHIEGLPVIIEERAGELATLYAEVFGSDDVHNVRKRDTSNPLPDTLLEKALAARNGDKFERLFYRGDKTGYASASEADQALANLLVFWCGGDALLADDYFRQSALMRSKWDERRGAKTYGARTIDNALNAYTPSLNGKVHPAGGGVRSDSASSSGEETRLTDLGNAERFVQDHGGDVRYVHPWNAWLLFDGKRWLRDETGAIMRLAKDTVRRLRKEALSGNDTNERAALVKHALASERITRLEAMVKLARSEPGIPALPDEFDTNPFLFNVQNGTLDLKTGMLHERDRAHLLTKISPVAYDPAARCPTWHAFLEHIMDGDDDLTGYLQRLVGYSLTGNVSEQIVALLWGVGANGKSTLLECVRFVLGDYGMHTPTTTLMVRRADGPTNDLARLRGARFVSAVETSDGRRLNEALVKQVTGGEPVSARYLYGEFFEYHPSFKLFLATNHKPEIRGTDEGIWRRIHLIPFTVTIPPSEQDRGLLSKLKAEAPGILVWALEGCLTWQQEGLNPPPAVVHATNAYRAEMDTMAGFLDDCCEMDWPGTIVPEIKASKLYAAFRSWTERCGEVVESSTKFGAKLRERGFERVRRKDGNYYKGITLKTD